MRLQVTWHRDVMCSSAYTWLAGFTHPYFVFNLTLTMEMHDSEIPDVNVRFEVFYYQFETLAGDNIQEMEGNSESEGIKT